MAVKWKLKIGVVVDQLIAGGVQIAAIKQVKNLNQLGHQARLLILMRKKYPTDFSYLVKKVPHQYLSDSYPRLFRQPIKFPIFTFFSTLHLLSPILAPRIIKKGDYDILVSHGTTTCLTTQALWRVRQIPYLAIIHDPMVYILKKCYSQTLLRLFFPILMPLAKLVEQSFVKDAVEAVVVSKVHFPYIKKTYGVAPKILTHGCQTLKKLPKKRGDYLLSFGRWQMKKNPQFLLKLIKSLPKTKLILAGSWINQEELEEFKGIVQKERIENRVKVVPHYTEEELKKLCAQSRLWLHAHFEAFGLAGLEATGHGLPIIIPEKSGVTEIFQHGSHGFFPKKIDLKEYRKYVKKLLKDEHLARQMGKTAWQVVRKNYSWEANGKKLLALIQSSLGLNQKPNFTILETGHSLGTSLAGGDKLMEPMAKILSGNYQFTVIVPKIGAKHWEDAPLEKIIKILPENRFDKSASPIPVFLTYCLRMWQTYQILARQFRLDLLYSSTNILPDVLPAYFAKKRRPKVFWIARVHHLIPSPHHREGKLIVNCVSYLMQILSLQMIKKRADIIIALNQRLKTGLSKGGFPEKNLSVLGAGIEFQKINQFKPKKKVAFDGVFLGRLHVTKGIFDTIPIWKKVVEDFPHANLAIIGDGPINIKTWLKREIKKAGLSENIKVLGFLPYSEVFTIMKQAKVFLFLDHEAGWGLAVAEAMACKLPVVGYNLPIFGDVYQAGFKTVKLRNTEAFAKQVVNLLSNKQTQKILSEQAYKQAQQLDWEYSTNKFVKLLRRV